MSNTSTRQLRRSVAITILTVTLFYNAYCQVQQDALLTHEQYGDSVYSQHRWGLGLSGGGVAGGIGVHVFKRTSENITIDAGGGYWSFSTTIRGSGFDANIQRREMTLFACGRLSFAKAMYLETGVSARRIEGIVKAFGAESKTDAGSVGVPLAIGVEIGKQKEFFTVNAEVGFALYAGPGADEIELALYNQNDGVSTTITGSSGLLIGIGITYYF